MAVPSLAMFFHVCFIHVLVNGYCTLNMFLQWYAEVFFVITLQVKKEDTEMSNWHNSDPLLWHFKFSSDATAYFLFLWIIFKMSGVFFSGKDWETCQSRRKAQCSLKENLTQSSQDLTHTHTCTHANIQYIYIYIYILTRQLVTRH